MLYVVLRNMRGLYLDLFEIMTTFRVRAATQNDVLGMAKVRVDTWKAAYNGIIPDDFLESMSYQTVAERWRDTYRRFNESLGGKVVREKTQEIGGKLIKDIGYGWEGIDALL